MGMRLMRAREEGDMRWCSWDGKYVGRNKLLAVYRLRPKKGISIPFIRVGIDNKTHRPIRLSH